MTQSQIEEAKIQEQSDTRARIRHYVDEAEFVMDVHLGAELDAKSWSCTLGSRPWPRIRRTRRPCRAAKPVLSIVRLFFTLLVCVPNGFHAFPCFWRGRVVPARPSPS